MSKVRWLWVVVIVLVVAAGVGFAVHRVLHHLGAWKRPDAAGVVWLCRPGASYDPCTGGLHLTSVPATGSPTSSPLSDASSTPFDCFYVYPTVSTQTSANANLDIDAEEIGAAFDEAAPFSQLCQVYAPMYRQRTTESLLAGLGSDPASNLVAYDSLLVGWNDFLKNYDDGRPIIFIGDSQGAAMLITLLRDNVDNDPAIRSRVVSAILLGGNVTVPTGKVVGGTFHHLPLCQTSDETGCVIAYSSFPNTPPANSNFGRPGQGVSFQSDQTSTTGLSVACVNPASLSSGSATLTPWFLNEAASSLNAHPSTSWLTYPGLYDAACTSADGATWLQVTDDATPTDERPVVSETLGPAWGYHLYDMNLGFGDLLQDVHSEESAYAREETAAH
jgi:hypothetical protein